MRGAAESLTPFNMSRNPYLDSRDLEERIDELEALENAVIEAREARDEAETEEQKQAREEQVEKAEAEFDTEAQEELKALRNLRDEVGGEWRYGVTLIPENEFEDYCRELVEDIGDLPKGVPGYIVIDWEATANNIRQDYSEAEFQGVNYLFRA